MTIAAPLFLLVLVPLAAAAWMLVQGRAAVMGRLPGGWNAIVEPQLKRFIAGKAAMRRNRTPLLALMIAALIALALARPGGSTGAELDYTGVAGRVVVIDATTDPARQAVFVRQLQDATPRIPTAIVLSAADAYLMVPFTTDPAQIHRYLNVYTPDMMPGEGRRLHLGIAMGEDALKRAGYLVGQIILTSDAPPPEGVAIAPSETIRTVAALTDAPGEWQDFASDYGADLIGGADANGASEALISRARAKVEATLPGARFDLSPWLIGLAVALTLPLFRRRAA